MPSQQTLYEWRKRTRLAMHQTRARLTRDRDSLAEQIAELDRVIAGLDRIELRRTTMRGAKATAKATAAKPKRVVSAAGRKAISEARRRWWRQHKAAQRAKARAKGRA